MDALWPYVGLIIVAEQHLNFQARNFLKRSIVYYLDYSWDD